MKYHPIGSVIAIAGVALFLFGDCSADEPTTALRNTAGSLRLTAAISDASRGGNPGFYFRPPIAPITNYPGTFDLGVRPTVEICEWSNAMCVGGAIAVFSMDSSRQSGRSISVSASQYSANWKTSGSSVVPGKVYRIHVWASHYILGYADIAVVRNGQEAGQLDLNQYAPVVFGAALPIHFRIEQGAVPIATVPIGPDGGQVSLPGIATLVVPPGALSSTTPVTLQATTSAAVDQRYLTVAPALFDAGPRMPFEIRILTGTTIPSQPLTVTLTPSPTFLAGLPPLYVMQPFAQIWEEGDLDVHDVLEPVTFTQMQDVEVQLTADYFTHLRRADGQNEAILLIGSVQTSISSSATVSAALANPSISSNWSVGSCWVSRLGSPLPLPIQVTSLASFSNSPRLALRTIIRRHMGIDLHAKFVPFFAAHDGTIIANRGETKPDPNDPTKEILNPTGFGYFVVIQKHNSRSRTLYAHLKSKPDLSVGTHVNQGQFIGMTGDTGGAKDGPHLHFEYLAGAGTFDQSDNRFDPDPCLPVVIRTTTAVTPLTVGDHVLIIADAYTSNSNIDENDQEEAGDLMQVGAPQGVSFFWSSSNGSVASVTPVVPFGNSATVTALAPGNTQIQVSGQGGSYSWDVQVLGSAQTIDFTSIGCTGSGQGGGANFYESPFTIDGFTFTNLSSSGFGTWCTGASHYPNSPALFNGGGNTTAVLTKAGGGVFAIQSISLAQLYSGLTGRIDVVFTGEHLDGSRISQTFSVVGNGGRPVFQQFNFMSLFSNLVKLSWNQGGNDLHQFDNIVVVP